jgi:hypothetical protein
MAHAVSERWGGLVVMACEHRTSPRAVASSGSYSWKVSGGRFLIVMSVCILAAACSAGKPSVDTTGDLDSRYCAAVHAWFVANELQNADEPERHAQRVDAVRSTFVALAQEYEQAGRSDGSVEITKATDRMGDYAAVLTEPFAPHADQIFLSVYAALRATGIRCPSPIFPT